MCRGAPDRAEQIRLDLAHHGVLVHDLGGIVEQHDAGAKSGAGDLFAVWIAAKTSSRRDFVSVMGLTPWDGFQ